MELITTKTYAVGTYRWRILALLFFSTTLNYLDRNVLSILAPMLQRKYSWSEIDYSYIVTGFQLAYGLGVILVGKLLDRFGSRMVFAIAILVWSLADMAHAMAITVTGFVLARFFLGLGESANFPACVKTVAEWFPKKERALATGIFNAGSNIGAILGPLMIPFIVVRYGWQVAFVVTGAMGFVWLVCWLLIYRIPERHSKVSADELNYIQSDAPMGMSRVPWIKLITRRETIAICMSRFFTDPVWWFLLYWLPKFLDKEYHISLVELGAPLIVIYLIADLGGIAGGWLSSHLMRKGLGIDKSRKRAMLICAVCALPVMAVAEVPPMWVSVGLIALACAAHCGWAANIYTIVSDQFPKNSVATIIGISTFTAVAGSMLASSAIGFLLETTGSYSLIFMVASVMYLVGWLVIKIGIPVIRPLQLQN